MTGLFILLALFAVQDQPPASAWTWTLYDGENPVVLANEVPDTAHLRSTFECEAGSGVAQVSIYDFGAVSGFVRFGSGTAVATSQIASPRDGTLTAPLRTDHPAFAAFVTEGRLTLTVGDRQRIVEVPRPHLAKLRRFAELCAG